MVGYSTNGGQPQTNRPAPSGRSVSGAPQVSTPVYDASVAPKANSLPPRTNPAQNLMNFTAVNDTPAEEMEIDFTDDSAIDDIFKED